MAERNLLFALGAVALAAYIRKTMSSSSSTRRYTTFNNPATILRLLRNNVSVSSTVLGVNVLTFLAWAVKGSRNPFLTRNFTTSPLHLDEGLYHTLITQAVSHPPNTVPLQSVLNNLLSWMAVAPALERALSPRVFAVHVMTSAVVSALAQILYDRSIVSKSSGSFYIPITGLSSVVFASNVTLTTLYPDSTVVMMGVVEMTSVQALALMGAVEGVMVLLSSNNHWQWRSLVGHLVAAVWGYAFVATGLHGQIYKLLSQNI
eukprot:PhF_6_TR33561/c0_g1_i2/m.48961